MNEGKLEKEMHELLTKYDSRCIYFFDDPNIEENKARGQGDRRCFIFGININLNEEEQAKSLLYQRLFDHPRFSGKMTEYMLTQNNKAIYSLMEEIEDVTSNLYPTMREYLLKEITEARRNSNKIYTDELEIAQKEIKFVMGEISKG